MPFAEFLKHNNKEKNSNSSPDPPVFPLHANRNVAKLFENKMRRDSEPSEALTAIISTKSSNKRNSKSEENIFEKIEAGSVSGGVSNKRYGTLPKSKLLCSSDKDNDDESESYENQKVRSFHVFLPICHTFMFTMEIISCPYLEVNVIVVCAC